MFPLATNSLHCAPVRGSWEAVPWDAAAGRNQRFWVAEHAPRHASSLSASKRRNNYVCLHLPDPEILGSFRSSAQTAASDQQATPNHLPFDDENQTHPYSAPASGRRRRVRPPLLFVHGGYATAGCWDEYFLPWFSGRGFDCHALDLAGHGGSESREQLHSYGTRRLCRGPRPGGAGTRCCADPDRPLDGQRRGRTLSRTSPGARRSPDGTGATDRHPRRDDEDRHDRRLLSSTSRRAPPAASTRPTRCRRFVTSTTRRRPAPRI
jgi:hypothetical protein